MGSKWRDTASNDDDSARGVYIVSVELVLRPVLRLVWALILVTLGSTVLDS